MTTFHADAEGVTTDDIVAKLLASVPSPADEAKSRKL
jgi:hypothetical protein